MKKKILSLIFIFTFAVISSSPLNVENTSETTVEEEYIVHRYDTLWNVMKAKIGDREDVREYIFLTIQKNGIEGAQIYPGQKITLVLPKN